MGLRWRWFSPVMPVATDADHRPTSWGSNGSTFWQEFTGNGRLGERVGTVDRCLQLNAQQIAKMPLRYRHDATTLGYEPAWIANPDPAWYPNGIGDAVFAAVWSIYARGEAFLWVTSRYETGFPRTWTVLDAATMKVENDGGARVFESNGFRLDTRDVLQVQRNPHGQLRGSSVLEAYAANIASAYQAESYAADVYQSTGVNRVALKSQQRLDADQAAALQAQWSAAVSRRMGAPAILPPGLDLVESGLSMSPKDMMLLESREWDARQIAAAFGVPAILLNLAVEGGLVYQNPAMLVDLWWRTELMPAAGRVQQALSRWLPRGSWVEFDPTRVLQPDLATMTSTWSQLLADGVVSVDEYRAAVLDLPPLERGEQTDEFYEEPGAHDPPALPAAAEDIREEVLV